VCKNRTERELLFSDHQKFLAKYSIDISKFPDGVYLLEIIADGEKMNQKLLKK
jgi:hypothetical protein